MRRLPRLLLAAAALFAAADAASQELYERNADYRRQTELFALYGDDTVDVVMLGNSLTAGAQWHEVLRGWRVAGRGIRSDVTAGYLARLDGVFRLHPRVCVVEGGINDLYAGVPEDEIVRNMGLLVRRLAAGGITPVVQSVLPVSPLWKGSEENNPRVHALNARLRALAADEGAVFLDIVPAMTVQGRLRDDLTYDGVHLTARGYAVWAEHLRAELRRLLPR